MPTLKRNVSDAPDTTGFESYDGPEPPVTARMYRGKIEFARVREASTGTLGLNLLVKFEANKGDSNVKYDGYPAWCSIWLADKEPNLFREKAFYRAVGVPDDQLEDVKVIHDDLDDGGNIKKVGGRKPVGRVVMVDMKVERDQEGSPQLRADAIFPVKKQTAEEPEDKGDEDPDEDLEDAAESDEGDYEEREEELNGMSLPKLKKIAKGVDIDPTRKNKETLIEEILEAEFPEDDEGDEGDDDPDEQDEPDEPDLPDHAEISKKGLPALRKWAIENGGYEADDLKGVKKDEILEMLVDDEIISNPEPPF